MISSIHTEPGVAALKCELAADVLQSCGELHLRASGWSMLPAIWPGDLLIIRRRQNQEVATGDVVVFGRGTRLVAHRVVEKKENGFGTTILTRGDAVSLPDSPLSESELLGKLVFIVRNGKRILPGRQLPACSRVVVAVLRRCEFAARVLMRAYEKLQSFGETLTDRVHPCQN
jgi:signal peptidase